MSSLGYAWQQVAIDQPCDIAHVAHPDTAPAARLRVRADVVGWDAPHRWHLESMAPGAGAGGDALIGAAGTWIDRDVALLAFWLATGQAERHWPQDKHGFYQVDERVAGPLFDSALASAAIRDLGRTLAKVGAPAPEPAWPNGKVAAAAITHDVDYPEVVRWLEPLRVVGRQGKPGLSAALAVAAGRRHHWHFEDWQALEREYGARSAFYFVARKGSLIEYAAGTPDSFYDITAPRFRQAMRALMEGGWEIGLHASYNAYQSTARFAAEKQRLEEACGCEVVGNRHHYWHMNPVDVEETLLMHEQVGFAYDSSLAHNAYLGWRRGLAMPFYPYHQGLQRELATLQLPVAWMDAQLFTKQQWTQAEREARVAALIDRAADVGGLFVMNVHDYVFDDQLFPGWMRALRAALDHISAHGGFWLATPGEIAQHWRERYARLRAESQGLAVTN